jgi:hypothetical protein
MAEFNVRADAVNVEQIMEQIRARIREKRGVDYTEEQIRELAAVKLEKFLDPSGLRSDLLEEFRRAKPAGDAPAMPNFAFDETTLYDTHRGLIRWIRRLLNPFLKLLFNPNPLIQALHIQSRLNIMQVEAEARRRARDQLTFEVLHNLVLETTRIGIQVKNLTMRVESLASRLEFNERRARALESAVVYKPEPERSSGTFRQPPPDRGELARHRPDAGEGPAQTPPAQGGTPHEGPGQRSRRRRRRRGRRSGPPAAEVMAGMSSSSEPQPPVSSPVAAVNEQPPALSPSQAQGEGDTPAAAVRPEAAEPTDSGSRKSEPDLLDE